MILLIVLLVRLVLLPVRLALGLTAFTFKTGYRTGSLLGYRRLFVLGLGVAIGLMLAPVPGRELRERLRSRLDGIAPPVDAELEGIDAEPEGTAVAT